MKLKAYLSETGTSYSAFAEKIGTSAEAVRRYVTGTRMPTPDVMARIVAATEGTVEPNDFYDIAPERAPEGTAA